MASLRRATALGLLVVAAGSVLAIAEPSPPRAEANVVCDTVDGPVDAVTGAVGLGSPAGDVCNAVTAPTAGVAGKVLDPLKDAAGAVGHGIFTQITAWVAEGATWLLGEVARVSGSTTTPDLLSKGFLSQYRQMAAIAAAMAALMVLFAVAEAVARADLGLLVRVVAVNLPLAAIATTAAYVVVQLLLAATDGLCHLIASSAEADTKEFFGAAIKGLSSTGADVGDGLGGPGGEGGLDPAEGTGAVAVPLFVGLIAAVLAAFAAFFVWIELLMRDAAVYAVSLFMPFALAAAVWPRWTSVLRRTAELLIVIVFSKFVIVSVLALAASLLASGEGGIEHVLAAGALLLVACFSPLLLMRLVPFAEGALAAAHTRQSAAGGAVQSFQLASSAAMMRHHLQGSWGGSGVQTLRGGGGGGHGGGAQGGGGGRPGGKPSGGGAGAAGGAAGPSAGASAAGGPAAAAAAAAPAAIGKGGRSAGQKLGQSGVAEASAGRGGGASGGGERGAGQGQAGQPPIEDRFPVPTRGAGAEAAEPTEAKGGNPGAPERPPRPRPETGTAPPKKGSGK